MQITLPVKRSRLSVHMLAMGQINNEYSHNVVLQGADHSIVAYSISPVLA